LDYAVKANAINTLRCPTALCYSENTIKKVYMKRLFLSNKDVQIITGRGRSATQYLVSAIKLKINKQKYQPLTVPEFCEYMGLSPDLVLAQLAR
jgi:hypothetical protein